MSKTNALFMGLQKDAWEEAINHIKNLCNVFGQGLDPIKNECAYRAVKNAHEFVAEIEE